MRPNKIVSKGIGIIELLRKLSQYIVLLLSVAVIGLTIHLGLRPFVGPAIGVLLGSILAVMICASDITITPDSRHDPIDWRLNGIIISLYVSIVFLSYHTTTWTRPTLHYAFFGGVIGYIGYQIYRGQSRFQVLLQLAIIGLVTYWSSQLAFPTGAASPDTPGILEGIMLSRESGQIVDGVPYSNTPVQLIIIIQAVIITNLGYNIIYILLATFLLVVTIPLIGIIDRIFPTISRDYALYSALFFTSISYTLNRGFYPHKNNFFTAMIIIVVLGTAYAIFKREERRQWALIGIITFVAMVAGHTFSAGATVFIIGSFLIYVLLVKLSDLLSFEYNPKDTKYPLTLMTLFIIGFLTYSLFFGSRIIDRIARTIISVVGIGSGGPGGSSGGRYAEMDIGTLLLSTSSEIIIFSLSVVGIVIAFKYNRQDIDMLLCWITVGFGLIAFGLFLNALDIPIQRIYGLLALFGLNIMMAIAFHTILELHPDRLQGGFVFFILLIISATFLASPIAGIALSPYSDDIPHVREYDTAPDIHGVDWVETHAGDDTLMMYVPTHNIPLQPKSNNKIAEINYDKIDERQAYMYHSLAEESGLFLQTDLDDRVLGGRDVRYLEQPRKIERDDKVFNNGEVSLHFHRTS